MVLPHLLQVTPYYPPDYEFGGPVRLVSELAARLAHDAQVSVYTYQHYIGRDYHDSSDLTVRRFSPLSRMLSRKANLYASVGLQRALPQAVRSAHVVHTHDYRSVHNITLLRAAQQAKVPVVMSSYRSVNPATGQRQFKAMFDALVGKRMLKRVSQFIAVNAFEVEDLHQFGINDQRITVIPNATDVMLPEQVHPDRFRKAHNILPNQPVVLFFSRLDYLKRPDLAVAAFAQVHQQVPNAVLVLYGPDYGMLHSLQQQIQQLNLTNHVRLIDRASMGGDHDAYAAADVLLLPSPSHEFPLVLLEAMAHGVPVVTSERSIAEVIDEQCGYVTEPTATALAKAALTILQEPSKALQFKAAGPKLYQQQFTFDRYAEQVRQVYARYITA